MGPVGPQGSTFARAVLYTSRILPKSLAREEPSNQRCRNSGMYLYCLMRNRGPRVFKRWKGSKQLMTFKLTQIDDCIVYTVW